MTASKSGFDLAEFMKEVQQVVRKANPVQQAQIFIRGRKEYGLSNRRIADLAGCSDGHVRNMLRMLDLSLEEQNRIAAGGPYRMFLDSGGRARESAASLDYNSVIEGGREAIREWCVALELPSGYSESAVRQASFLISSAEVMRALRESSSLWQGTPDFALRLFMPAGYGKLAGLAKVNAAGECIARALAYLVPNWEIRRKVLVEALMDLDPYRKR
jgi:hypothetical protein